MGIDHHHFTDFIIRPSLESIDMWSLAAQDLILGTVAQESYLGKYLHQICGPALGVYQIEPATHKDIWVNYIEFRSSLKNKVIGICPLAAHSINDDLLVFDLRYATVIARLIYYRRPEPLPPQGALLAQAAYWKQHYNTPQGRGTQSAYIANARKVGLG